MEWDGTTSRRRWVVLALGTLTQASTTTFAYGVALIVPAIRQEDHISLVGVTLIIAAPSLGMIATLMAWGAAADRFGERRVIATGVGSCSLILVGAAFSQGPVALGIWLVFAGATGAAVNAASGRMVMGWFSVAERGLAMGIRQTAQPVGLALAALALPPLAQRFGAHHCFLYPAGLCALMAILVRIVVIDPPRPQRNAGEPAEESPYKGGTALWRIHLSSTLLVVPQFAVATFTLVFLVSQLHWSAITAGRLIFGFQVVGALGRIASGVWSDRVGSRLRPMRQLAVASGALMVALAIGAWTGGWWIVAIFGLAAVITVADNGLAYVSVAEIAGSSWAGRALGKHNTVQSVITLIVPTSLGAIIEQAGYGVAFLVVAAAAVAAIPLIPVRSEPAHDAVVAI